MKKIVFLRFDNYDPEWPTRIHEAFDRLAEFAPELHTPPLPRGMSAPWSVGKPRTDLRSAYARIVCGVEDFTLADVSQVTDYGMEVAKTAREQATSVDGIKHVGVGPVIRASKYLEDTCHMFRKYIETFLTTPKA